MNEELSKITSFTDLIVWQKAHALTLELYKASASFPKEELFGLTSQMRRAALSITSNIAEGFGRRSYNEKIHFYSIARGSTTELQNQLILAHDIGYVSTPNFSSLADQLIEVHKMITALIKKSKVRVTG